MTDQRYRFFCNIAAPVRQFEQAIVIFYQISLSAYRHVEFELQDLDLRFVRVGLRLMYQIFGSLEALYGVPYLKGC